MIPTRVPGILVPCKQLNFKGCGIRFNLTARYFKISLSDSACSALLYMGDTDGRSIDDRSHYMFM